MLTWPDKCLCGRCSDEFASLAAAQAAPGPWQVGHPLHQPGWVIEEGECEVWRAAVDMQPLHPAAPAQFFAT